MPSDDARYDETDPQTAAADGAAGTATADAAPADEAERLRAEVKDLQDQLLRRAAEFQNYRRRTDQELGGAAARGREDVVTALLDVYDDLRRSIDAASRAAAQEKEAVAMGKAAGVDTSDAQTSGPAFDALRQGVELVYRKFGDQLNRLGVEAIDAVGQPFDENVHEAMLQQPAPNPETASGTVLAEVQPGYRMGERVLRHARVIVAR